MLRLVLAAAFVPVATAALAAAWTLERGQTQAFITSSFTYGDHGFDEDGKLISVPEYKKFELNAAVEYGVRPWLTAIARAELKQETSYEFVRAAPDIIFDPTNSGEYVQTAQSFGSVAGGARVRLTHGSVGATGYVVSTEATVMSGGMDTTGLGAQSDGPGAEARILVGASRSVFGRNVFGDLQVGFRKRFSEEDRDEVKVDATVGVKLTSRWMVLAQSFSTFAVDGEQDYHKVSASVVREVSPRLSVEVGAYRTLAGRNALQETGGRLGFWWTF